MREELYDTFVRLLKSKGRNRLVEKIRQLLCESERHSLCPRGDTSISHDLEECEGCPLNHHSFKNWPSRYKEVREENRRFSKAMAEAFAVDLYVGDSVMMDPRYIGEKTRETYPELVYEKGTVISVVDEETVTVHFPCMADTEVEVKKRNLRRIRE